MNIHPSDPLFREQVYDSALASYQTEIADLRNQIEQNRQRQRSAEDEAALQGERQKRQQAESEAENLRTEKLSLEERIEKLQRQLASSKSAQAIPQTPLSGRHYADLGSGHPGSSSASINSRRISEVAFGIGSPLKRIAAARNFSNMDTISSPTANRFEREDSARIIELEKELHALRSAKIDLLERVATHASTAESAQTASQSALSALKEAQSKLASAEALCKQKDNDIAGLESIKESLAAQAVEKAVLQGQIRQAAEELAIAKSAGALALERSEHLESDFRFAKESLAKSAQEQAEQIALTAKLQSELQKTNDEVVAAKAEKIASAKALEAARTGSVEQQAASAHSIAQIDSQNIAMRALEERLVTMSLEAGKQAATLTEVTASGSAAKMLVLQLQEDLDSRQKELDDRNLKLESMKSSLDSRQQGHSEKLLALEQQLKAARQKTDDLQGKLAAQQADLVTAEGEKANFITDLEGLKRSLAAITAERDSQSKDLDLSRAANQQLEIKIAASSAEVVKVAAEYALLQRASQNSEAAVAASQTETTGLQAVLRERDETVSAMTAAQGQTAQDLDAANKRIREVSAELAASASAIAQKDAVMDKLVSELKNARLDITKLNEKNKALEAQFNAAVMEIKELKEDAVQKDLARSRSAALVKSANAGPNYKALSAKIKAVDKRQNGNLSSSHGSSSSAEDEASDASKLVMQLRDQLEASEKMNKELEARNERLRTQMAEDAEASSAIRQNRPSLIR